MAKEGRRRRRRRHFSRLRRALATAGDLSMSRARAARPTSAGRASRSAALPRPRRLARVLAERRAPRLDIRPLLQSSFSAPAYSGHIVLLSTSFRRAVPRAAARRRRPLAARRAACVHGLMCRKGAHLMPCHPSSYFLIARRPVLPCAGRSSCSWRSGLYSSTARAVRYTRAASPSSIYSIRTSYADNFAGRRSPIFQSRLPASTFVPCTLPSPTYAFYAAVTTPAV